MFLGNVDEGMNSEELARCWIPCEGEVLESLSAYEDVVCGGALRAEFREHGDAAVNSFGGDHV